MKIIRLFEIGKFIFKNNWQKICQFQKVVLSLIHQTNEMKNLEIGKRYRFIRKQTMYGTGELIIFTARISKMTPARLTLDVDRKDQPGTYTVSYSPNTFRSIEIINEEL